MNMSTWHNPARHDEHLPKLKGRAAEVKTMTMALSVIWPFYADMTDPIHQQIGLALRKCARLDAMMTENTREYKLF